MPNELAVFTEIFPIHQDALPELTLYQLKVSGFASLDEIGGKVSYRLKTKFGKHWNWDRESKYLISDNSQNETSIMQALQEIWESSKEEETLRSLESINVCPNDKPSIQGLADFVAGLINDNYSQTINKALAQFRREEKTYYVGLRCNCEVGQLKIILRYLFPSIPKFNTKVI